MVENDRKKRSEIPEDRIGKVHSWSEMHYFLGDIDPNSERFLKIYYKIQWRIAHDQLVRARKLSKRLASDDVYKKFEEDNHDLLALIDMAVRGSTRWD